MPAVSPAISARWRNTISRCRLSTPTARPSSRARTAYRRLIAQHPDLTAICAVNDAMALGAMRAAQESGKSIPGDLSIVGFDDIPLASLNEPQLTTIRVPKRQMGAEVARTDARAAWITPIYLRSKFWYRSNWSAVRPPAVVLRRELIQRAEVSIQSRRSCYLGRTFYEAQVISRLFARAAGAERSRGRRAKPVTIRMSTWTGVDEAAELQTIHRRINANNTRIPDRP